MPDRVVWGVFGWFWGVSELDGGHFSSFSFYRFARLSCVRGRLLGADRLLALKRYARASFCRILSDSVDCELGASEIADRRLRIGDCRSQHVWGTSLGCDFVFSCSGHVSMVVREFCFVKCEAGDGFPPTETFE